MQGNGKTYTNCKRKAKERVLGSRDKDYTPHTVLDKKSRDVMIQNDVLENQFLKNVHLKKVHNKQKLSALRWMWIKTE